MSVASILEAMAANAGRAQLARGALIGNTISQAAAIPGQILDDREKDQIRQAAQDRLNAQDARGAAADERGKAKDARDAAQQVKDQADAAKKEQERQERGTIMAAGLDTTGPTPGWHFEPAVAKAMSLNRPDVAHELIDEHNKATNAARPKTQAELAADAGDPTSPTQANSSTALDLLKPPKAEPVAKPGTIHDTSKGLVRIGDDNTVTPLGVKGYHPPVADPLGGMGGASGVDVAKLPPMIRDQAQALVDGRRALDPRLASKPLGQTIINAAYALDPTFDQGNYNARYKARTDLTNPGGTGGKTIGALNTAIQHAGKLSDLIETLDNSNVPLVNAIVNPLKSAAGSTAVTNFDTVAPQLAKEIERVWRGAGGTAGEIHDLIDTIGHNKGKQQQREALQQFVELAKGKLDALETQRDAVMGKTAGASIPILFDQNKPIVDTIATRAGGTATAPTAAPRDGQPGSVNGVPAVWKTVNGTAGWYKR